MGVLCDEAGDAAQTEARAEAVDEMGEFVVGAGRVGKSGEPGGAELHRLAALGDKRGKPHHVEAEAGIAGVPDHRQPIGKQADDAVGIAHRRGGADLDAVDRVVGAEQRDLQQPRAVEAAFHGDAKLAGKSRNGSEHVALEPDRVGEALLGDIGGNGQARRDRLVLTPERLIETAHQLFAEAGGERGARQVKEIGDALETELLESFDDLGSKAQRRYRQRRQNLAHRAGGHDRPSAGKAMLLLIFPPGPRLRGCVGCAKRSVRTICRSLERCARFALRTLQGLNSLKRCHPTPDRLRRSDPPPPGEGGA